MSFAPPSLVATLLVLSPKLASLPAATKRAISEAGDVPGPGRYRVVGAPSGLNVRASGSTNAPIVATVLNGSTGTSDGTIDNGFAFVQYDSGPSGWSSVGYLAPEAQPAPSAGGGAPTHPDLPPGTYVVATQSDPLNLRSSPSTAGANIIGSIPKGAKVKASGMNQNYFAQVEYNGQIGWAASAYLVLESSIVQSQSGELVLSAADLLQLRTMLAAWANATQGAPSYGAPSDMALDAAAMARQGEVLAAFQKWSNANKGTALRTDGIVDQATRDALIAWSGAAVAGATPAGPTGLPTLPETTNVSDTPAATVDESAASQAKKTGLFALLAVGLAAFFLLEEKKK